MRSDSLWFRGAALAVILFLLFAGIALLFRSDSEAATTTAAASSTSAASTSTAAPTTTIAGTSTTAGTTTTVAQTETDLVSGDLLVRDLAAWDPVFNAGDLVRTSSLCSFFASETEAYSWLSAIRESEGDDWLAELDDRYDSLRADYWSKAPRAAANMLSFLREEKPWLVAAMRAMFGDDWSSLGPAEKMTLIDEQATTTVVMAPASFRTTGCSNAADLDDSEFRTVYRAQNVTVSPDDSDWVPTLVDVFLPSAVNAYLEEVGSDLRIQQVVQDDGAMAFQVFPLRGAADGTFVSIDRAQSVPVIVRNAEGSLVLTELVFSTACGNPALPEVNPPEKEPEVTTTTSSTTSTTAGTTTTSSSTTSTTAGTTTTSSSTTSTTAGTTTTLPAESFDFETGLTCDISGDYARYVLWIMVTDGAPGVSFNHVTGDYWLASVVGTHGYSVTVTATWPNSGGLSPLSKTARYTGDCGKSTTTTTTTTLPGTTTTTLPGTTTTTTHGGIPTTTLP